MTPQEIEDAAREDSDAQPLSAEDLRRMPRTPRTKIIRRALGLTQEQFSDHYHIPLGTLRDWEQGRTEPDQPARTYLQIIASDPEGVRKTLAATRSGPPERTRKRVRHLRAGAGLAVKQRGLDSRVKRAKKGRAIRKLQSKKRT